ncbi:hypothetical protein Tco_0754620 [Tanacetum coccineum]
MESLFAWVNGYSGHLLSLLAMPQCESLLIIFLSNATLLPICGSSFLMSDIPLIQASSWDSFNELDHLSLGMLSKEKKQLSKCLLHYSLTWVGFGDTKIVVTFNSQPLRKSDLFDNVRFSSFSWLHNRDHMKLSWNGLWLMYPIFDLARNGNGNELHFVFFLKLGVQVRWVWRIVRQGFFRLAIFDGFEEGYSFHPLSGPLFGVLLTIKIHPRMKTSGWPPG